MKQFVLLIKEDMEVTADQEQVLEMESLYIKWMDDLIASGNYVTGSRLDAGRKTLQPNGDIVSDGPYVETKEMIGGLIILKASDMNEAIALTKKCPMHAIHNIDIREVKHAYTI